MCGCVCVCVPCLPMRACNGCCPSLHPLGGGNGVPAPAPAQAQAPALAPPTALAPAPADTEATTAAANTQLGVHGTPTSDPRSLPPSRPRAGKQQVYVDYIRAAEWSGGSGPHHVCS